MLQRRDRGKLPIIQVVLDEVCYRGGSQLKRNGDTHNYKLTCSQTGQQQQDKREKGIDILIILLDRTILFLVQPPCRPF